MKNSNRFNKFFGSFLFVLFIIFFSSNLIEIIYNTINNIEIRGHTVDIENLENDSKNNNNSEKNNNEIKWNIPDLLIKASAKNGEDIFNKKCKSCHNILKNEGHKVGPNLNKIINSLIASKDFNYSKALIKYKDLGQKWDQENFFSYIYSPKNFTSSGGRMAFAGIKKENELADLFLYISSIE
jgi:cytochrome c